MVLLISINRIDAAEKSNFSTDAQRQWKLGSPSGHVSERGFGTPSPLTFKDI